MNSLLAEYKTRIFAIIFAAIGLAYFISAYASLGARWIVSFTLGLIIIFVGISLKNSKYFFLSLFFLSLPIITHNYIGQLSRVHYGGPAGYYITFQDFILAVLYLLWILRIVSTRTARLSFSKLDVCMWGLIGLSFLSMYNAVDKMLCLYQIFRLVVIYFVFVYMANAITAKSDFRFIITPLLVGLFLESWLGIFQYFRGEAFGLELMGEVEMVYVDTASRAGGTVGHPNTFAKYLSFFIPLTITLQFAPIKKSYKFFCALIFFVAVAALITTLSRAAWVGFIISMLALLFFGVKAKLFSLRGAIVFALVSAIILIILIFPFQELISTRLFLDDYGSAWSRIPLMRVAINIIRAHPFFGIGINNYLEVMQSYDSTPEVISRDLPMYVVHNGYLLLVSEVGIGGLLFLIWFLTQIFRNATETIRRDDTFINCIVVGIMAGFVSFLVQVAVMPTDIVSEPFFYFWILSGLIVALNRLSRKSIL